MLLNVEAGNVDNNIVVTHKINSVLVSYRAGLENHLYGAEEQQEVSNLIISLFSECAFLFKHDKHLKALLLLLANPNKNTEESIINLLDLLIASVNNFLNRLC